MRLSKAIFFIIIITGLFNLAGCGGPAPAPNTNANTANLPIANKANSNELPTNFSGNVKPVGEKTNDAQSVKPVIDAYYAALKSNDEAGLRKIYSAAALKELDAYARSEGRKTIADYITASEPVGDKPFEIRNEKIEGDSAIAEVKGGSYGSWIKWKFVKEGGAWKKAPPSEDLKLLGK